MSSPRWKMGLANVALLVFVVVGTAARSSAQDFSNPDIVFDWQTGTVQKTPSFINRKKNATLVIRRINNILYDYEVSVSGTPPAAPDDWGNFSNLTTRGARAVVDKAAAAAVAGAPVLVDACSKALDAELAELTEINRILNEDPNLPIKIRANGPPYPSIKVEDSVAAWAGVLEHLKAYRDGVAVVHNQCRAARQLNFVDTLSFDTVTTELEARVRPIQAKFNAPHEWRGTTELRPDYKYDFTVVELFEGVPTDPKGKVFKVAVPSYILTLSVGPVFSEIQDRAYDDRKSPTSTLTILTVEGNSRFRPEGIALLNYSIPGVDSELGGLALSAGPVIRFGSKSDLATLGFFTGISGHFRHRIFFTPGVHFGEFADFPVGFGNGSEVPASFGELTPVKRWTARFAFGISFQTLSFGNLVQGGEEAQPAASGGEATTGSTSRIDTANSGRQFAAHAERNAGAQAEAQPSLKTYGSAAPPDPKSLLRHVVSLNSAGAADGLRLTINADAPLGGFNTYTYNSCLYVVIPHARSLIQQRTLRGDGLLGAKIEQRGDDLVLMFVLQPGTTPNVQEKFNRLDILFAISNN
ncbi:MAG TPA: hypothetical protein VGX92_14360 [Pyrinomonadaceae bacterium]|jgi:hypothetical protein|nr:hypothetical protein [Pyrinomonadaceae bacterium]